MFKQFISRNSREKSRIAIVGTVGVPGRYGGFETLADNLVKFHSRCKNGSSVTVYCSAQFYPAPRNRKYLSAELRYLPLSANGAQSVIYDLLSMAAAVWNGENKILILGVSGAVGIPFLNLFPRVKVITNIDGIEWKRAKWNKLASAFLKFSEKIAVKYSDTVIADNEAIAEYVHQNYQRSIEVIAYGGDHAKEETIKPKELPKLPDRYALALCRIEPENNVEVILRAWARIDQPLVFVGNWNNSNYGRELKKRFSQCPSITLVDPIYDLCELKALRDKAWLYVHGHSAGGTNPSLVEMMHFEVPVVAWDCRFNRFSTENAALYFSSVDALVQIFNRLTPEESNKIGYKMGKIARERYRWAAIAERYFELLED